MTSMYEVAEVEEWKKNLKIILNIPKQNLFLRFFSLIFHDVCIFYLRIEFIELIKAKKERKYEVVNFTSI